MQVVQEVSFLSLVQPAARLILKHLHLTGHCCSSYCLMRWQQQKLVSGCKEKTQKCLLSNSTIVGDKLVTFVELIKLY